MLTRLTLENFTLFQSVDFRFSKQLNVIHGVNGTGKTHVLKLAYALQHVLASPPSTSRDFSPTKVELQRTIAEELVEVFRPDSLGRLATRIRGRSRATVSAKFVKQGHRTSFSFQTASRAKVILDKTPTRWLDKPPVYLPTRELLSIYPGFVSLFDTHTLEFERTWRDLCVLLGAPLSKGVKEKRISEILRLIGDVMGGRIELDRSGRFYLVDERGRIEMHLVAEGMRKLAMLARLVATGSLSDKGCLLWDEPEANLNPRLVRKVAEVLVALAAQGTQIFVATHSLFFLREIHLLQAKMTQPPKIRYFGLQLDEGLVTIEQGDDVAQTGDFASLDADLDQSSRYLDAESGANGTAPHTSGDLE